MFENYDPREGRLLSLLDVTGKLAPSAGHAAPHRRAGAGGVQDHGALPTGGRVGREPQPAGTHAHLRAEQGPGGNSVGALMAVRPDDWFVPAFRELGGMLARGISLSSTSSTGTETSGPTTCLWTPTT